MVTVGDILQIKDIQSLVGIADEIMNVYYYEVLAMTGPIALPLVAETFSLNFVDAFVTVILDIQASQCAHTRLEVNNLMAYTTDFFSFTYENPFEGQVISSAGASSTTLSFQLVRQFRTTRNGRKGIGGIPVDWIQDNTALAAHVEEISSVQSILSSGLVFEVADGVEITLAPRIVRVPAVTSTPPTVINTVASAAFRGVGTQNTRKQLLS